jgi:hypothetical protein
VAVKVAKAEGGRVAGDEGVDHREPEIDRLLTDAGRPERDGEPFETATRSLTARPAAAIVAGARSLTANVAGSSPPSSISTRRRAAELPPSVVQISRRKLNADAEVLLEGTCTGSCHRSSLP